MEIRDRICELLFDKIDLTDYQLDKDTMIEDINIFDDLAFDSLQFIQLIVRIEDAFGIEIDDNTLLFENFSTLSTIIDTVSNLIGVNGGERNDK